MRVTVLWQQMSGYFDACLRALAAVPEVEVSVAYPSATVDAPFDKDQFTWLTNTYEWSGAPDTGRLNKFVSDSNPDVVLMSSWHIRPYREAVRSRRSRTLTILCMDNQWRERPKQWLGRLTRRVYLAPLFDMAFVPGDRQAEFARLLGFGDRRILRGLYCCDADSFTDDPGTAREDAFLFVGRLIESKGIAVLAQAYEKYRSEVADPWPLRVAGVGPLDSLLREIPGVELTGFVQPAALPSKMWRSRALVLPSTFEPWGVVVHEATCAGMIVLCSEAVGAGTHLVQDGYNGFVVPVGDSDRLAERMLHTSSLGSQELQAMSYASSGLSRQFSPQRWASYLVDAVRAEGILAGRS